MCIHNSLCLTIDTSLKRVLVHDVVCIPLTWLSRDLLGEASVLAVVYYWMRTFGRVRGSVFHCIGKYFEPLVLLLMIWQMCVLFFVHV